MICPKSKCKKKPFLLLEALIALAILSLCLFPFIPKTSERLLKIKQKAACLEYAYDFESRLCKLREDALRLGASWVAGKKEGAVLLQDKQICVFHELGYKSQLQTRLKLYKIYKKKGGQGLVYRLKLECVYGDKRQKKELHTAYLTLED